MIGRTSLLPTADGGGHAKRGASPTASRLRPALLGLVAAIVLSAVPGTARPAGGIGVNPRPTIAFVRESRTTTTNDAEIYTIDANNVVKQLTDNRGYSLSPAWSPDGARIAFVRQDTGGSESGIYLMNADGSGVTRLTTELGGDSEPAWSPDGRKIAFASNRDGDYDIFVLDLVGRSVQKLTDNIVADGGPAWSPDGTKIAFASNTTGVDRSREIFLMNADGTGVTNLTNSPDCNEGQPDWKPDGTRLLFGGCFGTITSIVELNLATGGVRAVTTSPTASEPDWSPDGQDIVYTDTSSPTAQHLCLVGANCGVFDFLTLGEQADWQPGNSGPPAAANGRIVFASDRSGDLELYSMNTGGLGQTQLTSSPGDDTYPVWSPNGAQIAFTSARSGSFNIYRMAASGGTATPVTSGAASDLEPTWAPDGSRIAFVSDRAGGLEIFSIGIGGTGLAQLTSTGGFNVDPVWSPDGNSIVFTSNRNGADDVYVMRADGSGQTQLTTDPARDYGPYWSPDGNRIVFQSDRDGNSELYVMNADGSGQTRLTTDPGVDSSPAWSPDGTKIVFHSNRDGDFEIFSINADGTGLTQLTGNTALDKFPDWQRVVTNADVDPPVLTVPASITVDATSPAGAIANYAVSAADAVDPLPVVSCAPASGSTFAIGATIVQCTASDISGNTSTGSFTVTVVGAKDQLIRLVADVVGASSLPPAASNPLVAAARGFNPSDPLQRRTVCRALGTFTIVLQPLARAGLVPPAKAAGWIADARRIRAVLGC